MFVVKDELDHFEEKFLNNIGTDFLFKKVNPDPVQLFQIHITAKKRLFLTKHESILVSERIYLLEKEYD
jgi:hypothetical protein